MTNTKETAKGVNHQQASQLLHNKFVVVLGDSIQRSVYKDLVLLIQKEQYLTLRQLKSKGEMSFEQDCLVEGGCLSQMHNGTGYQEVRQFQSAHHLVRFYFVTRIYSNYMQSILDDFHHGLKPDVLIVNSCVWDISRYNSCWIDDYEKNLCIFFDELNRILPEETLVIWNLTMPLAEKIKGGFLVPEIEHKAPQLRHDVIEANFYSGTLADTYRLDVLDLHFQFRFSLHHRSSDGVHWNALAHRRITSLLLQHMAEAWGVVLSGPLTPVETRKVQWPSNNHHPPAAKSFSNMERADRKPNAHREELFCDSLPRDEGNSWQQQTHRHQGAGAYRPLLSPPPPSLVHRHKHRHRHVENGVDHRHPHHFGPYGEHHHLYVMRSRRSRHHYAPYPHHSSNHYAYNGRHY